MTSLSGKEDQQSASLFLRWRSNHDEKKHETLHGEVNKQKEHKGTAYSRYL